MKCLADTSVWIDHLQRKDVSFARALEEGAIVCHPMVIGELACGSMRNRQDFLYSLKRLPCVMQAEAEEVLDLIEEAKLWGKGLGLIDVHLLAASRINGLLLWTKDRKLNAAANRLGVEMS